MFWTIFLLSIIILALSLLGMSIQIFLSKKKSFPEYRIGHNKELQKRKIYCPRTEQKLIDSGKETYCSGCK